MNEEKLVMSFEPATIEHLGVKMYSTLPPALAEMIANAYDACSNEVVIDLYDQDSENKKIVISDDGIGMSFEEVNNYFLRIGRNRRKEGMKETSCERIATGKKGLGKLALFGIGDLITIETIQNYKGVRFTLDWNAITDCHDTIYSPLHEQFDSEKEKGTTIVLDSLKRKTPYNLDALALSLAMLFNFSDEKFSVLLRLNDSAPIVVDNKLKYENIDAEFEWDFQEVIKEIGGDYEYKDEIQGRILTTEKPLKPGLRGIALFSNGRMINSPEYFGQSESSHFFSYTTGWVNVDFVDNWEEDVISTNRQSIDWDNERIAPLRTFLRDCLNYLERQWRQKRKEKRMEGIQTKTQVDIPKWYNALPEEIQVKVEQIVNVIDESELTETDQASVVNSIHQLIPEYPYYHWRHLHNEVRDASKIDYENKDYYRAFLEAIKRYITNTRGKSGSTSDNDRGMMGEVYGPGKVLCVTNKYKKPDGTDFTPSTLENINDGQKFLSMGILAGARNPVSHEEVLHLKESGLFSERDCLDALSLLSHLVRRLDDV